MSFFRPRQNRSKPNLAQGEKWDRLSLERGDLPAMLLAALVTLLPAVLLVGALFALTIWALFLR